MSAVAPLATPIQIQDPNYIFYAGNNGPLGARFVSHWRLGVNQYIQPHIKNVYERTGDLGLWAYETLPEMIKTLFKNPKALTVALTIVALEISSFIFYPVQTARITWNAIVLLRHFPWAAVRLTAYIFTVVTICSTSLRAFGRFSNPDLMDEFYQSVPPVPAPQTEAVV